ncbi:MAG: DNA-binding response regulator [Bacteroidetes bacterium GWF2_33_16]|nr:MAG: DNA-binding response regulator [Bacteroidetes bacterium GWE2_32_14]OFY06957.1 MAG: DNA-binding response regulator [Bacteroidetes bacterium GWF2_33_16]
MTVVIIEDESFAAEKLERLLKELDPEINVLSKIESVKNAVTWLKSNNPDLIFLDIHLADGLCFRIFDEVEIKTPIIFTTAYDQYAIQAFKVNSVDYLLKPINKFDLAQSYEKFRTYHQKENTLDYQALKAMIGDMKEKKYQQRFLVVQGDSIKTVIVSDIAYFFADGKYTFLVEKAGERFLIDTTLEHLTLVLDPASFFRINRQIIINIDSIKKMNTWFSRRIKLELIPTFEKETIVSTERVKDFKEWLNQ